MFPHELKLDGATVKALCPRLDDNTSIFFARELEAIKAREEVIDYPELRLLALVPSENDIPEGAQTFTYRTYDKRGMAKVVSDYAKDFPRVDVLGFETTGTLRRIGDSFGWNFDELLSAQMAGRPLDAKRRDAAEYVLNVLENDIIAFGLPSHNLPGFLQNDNVPDVEIPDDGEGTSTDWDDKTNEQIIRTVNENTLGIEFVNTVVLPLTRLNLLKSRPMGAAFPGKTLFQYLVDNNPGVEFTWLNELETAGDGETRRIMGFNRSPMKVAAQSAGGVRQMPPEQKNMDFSVALSKKVGGVVFYKPLSAVTGDGI